MSLALASQLTGKFSRTHHDTEVMNVGSPPTGIERTLEVADKGAGMTPAIVERESSSSANAPAQSSISKSRYHPAANSRR